MATKKTAKKKAKATPKYTYNYWVEILPTTEPSAALDRLNVLGALGWKLVMVYVVDKKTREAWFIGENATPPDAQVAHHYSERV